MAILPVLYNISFQIIYFIHSSLYLLMLTILNLFIVCVICSVVFNSLQACGLKPDRLLYPWNFPGKNTGVGCHDLLRAPSQPRDQSTSPVSPTPAGGFFITVPPGKSVINLNLSFLLSPSDQESGTKTQA